jgi:hypothetical protein
MINNTKNNYRYLPVLNTSIVSVEIDFLSESLPSSNDVLLVPSECQLLFKCLINHLLYTPDDKQKD